MRRTRDPGNFVNHGDAKPLWSNRFVPDLRFGFLDDPPYPCECRLGTPTQLAGYLARLAMPNDGRHTFAWVASFLRPDDRRVGGAHARGGWGEIGITAPIRHRRFLSARVASPLLVVRREHCLCPPCYLPMQNVEKM